MAVSDTLIKTIISSLIGIIVTLIVWIYTEDRHSVRNELSGVGGHIENIEKNINSVQTQQTILVSQMQNIDARLDITEKKLNDWERKYYKRIREKPR
jgi:peptidoglycan hydrolase CwlO-like protein